VMQLAISNRVYLPRGCRKIIRVTTYIDADQISTAKLRDLAGCLFERLVTTTGMRALVCHGAKKIKDAEPKLRVPFEADHKGASALATETSDFCRWHVAPAVCRKKTEAGAFGCQNVRLLLQMSMAAPPGALWTLPPETSNLELL
jgi:hypothetical protein